MDEIRAKLDAIFQNIQNLQLQPNEHNVMLIADSLMKLKEVYAGLGGEPEAAEEDEAGEAEEKPERPERDPGDV